MTDKTAPRVTITHHPDVRRSPDDPEGLRRRLARAVPLHRHVPEPRRRRGSARRGRRAGGARQRPAAADRQGRRLRAGLRQARPNRCRPSAVRASCRTTRSSSTSATPRSTRSTRARPRSRHRTSSSARSSATRVRRSATSPAEIDEFITQEGGNGRLKAERALLAPRWQDVQAMAATLTGYLMAAQETPTELYKVGQGSVRFLMSVGDLVVGWLLLRRPRSPSPRSTRARAARRSPSTRARSRWRSSSPRTSCRC